MACLTGAADLTALSESYAHVAAAAECEMRPSDEAPGNVLRRRMTHVESGRHARRIHEPSIERTAPDTARINTGYTVGSLWGQGHSCRVVLIDGRWIPRFCEATWIS